MYNWEDKTMEKHQGLELGSLLQERKQHKNKTSVVLLLLLGNWIKEHIEIKAQGTNNFTHSHKRN